MIKISCFPFHVFLARKQTKSLEKSLTSCQFHQRYSPTFFVWKFIQSQTLSCRNDVCTKNLYVKRWWNWHLNVRFDKLLLEIWFVSFFPLSHVHLQTPHAPPLPPHLKRHSTLPLPLTHINTQAQTYVHTQAKTHTDTKTHRHKHTHSNTQTYFIKYYELWFFHKKSLRQVSQFYSILFICKYFFLISAYFLKNVKALSNQTEIS